MKSTRKRHMAPNAEYKGRVGDRCRLHRTDEYAYDGLSSTEILHKGFKFQVPFRRYSFWPEARQYMQGLDSQPTEVRNFLHRSLMRTQGELERLCRPFVTVT